MLRMVLGGALVASFLVVLGGGSYGVAESRNVQLEGIVMDGRQIGTPAGAALVIPADLSPVTGAAVSIPSLGVRLTTDMNGRFFASGLPVTGDYTKVDISATAPGFASWTVVDYELRSDSGGNRLYIELSTNDQTIKHIPFEERGERPSNAASTEVQPSESVQSSCSGYFSSDIPPTTIRVWRLSQGETFVRTYDFRFYVKNVSPNEWGASWHYESLRAGAEAVRQYGWYWVNYWRGGVAPDGSCYDVDDTINHQVFDPTSSKPATGSAVDYVWGWVLKKSGAFFETNYWSGYSWEACGYDTNGWQMRQWGTKACAEAGYGWQQIVTTYYYPGVTFQTPQWLPPGAWIDWGALWGGVVQEAKASATDFSQLKHSVLARVNGSNNWTLQWRRCKLSSGRTNRWRPVILLASALPAATF